MADILTKLSSKYGCDKSDKNHKYTSIYHRYFEKYRHKKLNLLEFGFGQGKSVKMWMEYFTKANLVTVDIRETLPQDKLILKHAASGRFTFVSADQIDMSKVLKIFDKYKKFYIMIDDASHVPEDQQYTFGRLFQFVRPGGWYIIEDLKCKRSHSTRFERTSPKTLKVLNRYLGNKTFNSNVLSPKQNRYITQTIESIKIYNKIAFIKKKG